MYIHNHKKSNVQQLELDTDILYRYAHLLQLSAHRLVNVRSYEMSVTLQKTDRMFAKSFCQGFWNCVIQAFIFVFYMWNNRCLECISKKADQLKPTWQRLLNALAQSSPIAAGLMYFTLIGSVETNRTMLVECTIPIIANCGQVDVVYIDLFKAFDLMDQNLLIQKLLRYGVCSNLCVFIRDYLNSRPTKVACCLNPFFPRQESLKDPFWSTFVQCFY